jgi:hypothetical protein
MDVKKPLITLFIIFSIYSISTYNIEDYTLEFLKMFSIVLFSIIWVIYISGGSIITNRYFIKECPKWCEKNKDHPWFKLSPIFQFLDILLSISIVVINFYIIRGLYKLTLHPNKSVTVGRGFLNKLLNIYLVFKTGSMKKCKYKSLNECEHTPICKIYNPKSKPVCATDNYWYDNFDDQITKNITILNAFLTILFQTNLKNKLEYFIKEYVNTNKYLSNPDIIC